MSVYLPRTTRPATLWALDPKHTQIHRAFAVDPACPDQQIYIDVNGQMWLAKTVWQDFMVPMQVGKVPASNNPTWEKITDDGAGSVGVFGYSFVDGDYIFLPNIQMPHSWKVGSTIYPHIHFETTSDVSPSDNFKIGIEYLWTNVDAKRSATTSPATRDVPTGVNKSLYHQLSNVPATGISGTGKTISSIIQARLYRAAADTDNYADKVFIHQFDIHFEIDSFGSINQSSK